MFDNVEHITEITYEPYIARKDYVESGKEYLAEVKLHRKVEHKVMFDDHPFDDDKEEKED